MSTSQSVIGATVVAVVSGLAINMIQPQLKKLEFAPTVDMSFCKKPHRIDGECISTERILEDYMSSSTQSTYRYQGKFVTILGNRWRIDKCYGLGITDASNATPCVKFPSGWFSEKTVVCQFPMDDQLLRLADTKYANKTIALGGQVQGFEKDVSVVRLTECHVANPTL